MYIAVTEYISRSNTFNRLWGNYIAKAGIKQMRTKKMPNTLK